MAKKGFDIDVGMNTREVQRGAGDIESALGEVADSLDDVARDADKAGREIGDELTEGAKDATRSVDRLERSFKDMADASKRETRTAATAMSRDMKEGADSAAAATAEFKDEALSNLSETVSSFRGDASDIVQIVQDTFGGVVSNLGPLGAAAGVAGAIGLGLMMQGFEDAEEKEQQFRERVEELAQVLIETGGEGAEALQAVADRLLEMAAPSDETAISLAKLERQSELTGISVAELARAYAGAGGDLTAYIEKVDEQAAALRDAQLAAQQSSTESTLAASEQYAAVSEVSDGLRELARQQEGATEAARIYAEEGLASTAARAEQMSALQGELDKAIGAWSDYQDKETGAVDPAGYLAGMQTRMDATANFNINVQSLAAQFGLTFEETQAILDQGVDFAPMLQSIIDSGMGEQYATQVRAMLDGGQAIIDGTPTTATVTTRADTAEADAQLEQAAAEREAGIVAEASTTTAARQLDAVAAQSRTAKITAIADLTAAAAALDRLIEERTITIRARVVDQRGVEIP